MIKLSGSVEPIYPSATVILMRDAHSGPEVLLVQRSTAVKHMGGMWVFPGGRVDPADDPGDGDPLRTAMNAAIRETEEEAGLKITEDQLEYLSHWTTPEGAKKRFSTWFFLAILEDDQEVQVDGGEIAFHRWLSPRVAFEEIRDPNNPFRLMPPTYVSLVDLADYSDCQAAREAIAKREPISYVPNMVFIEGGICFLYEEDAGYVEGDEQAEGPRHRSYMLGDHLEYICQY
ncbi:NUDIX hydrolase [Parahaliea sp. F7430]|uniref:NUDIX hydrolase n=1 Tax=Sediminihaliea albiluteola TaxID=2758564 RepID=A0A7W2TVL2_9GAMM|nr:NUDIX hydrolase [Sediminihaliea albiluteola]MBA6412782.1 NUDIX hydrolase [Sediminihaliea albiluteola]